MRPKSLQLEDIQMLAICSPQRPQASMAWNVPCWQQPGWLELQGVQESGDYIQY
ncbi:hypothetical protein [Methanothrix sp.]|uniref:hypothetical protein n=1 Tax=Methanothrix sp. TaxID=90426 RepID=UPI00345EFE74